MLTRFNSLFPLWALLISLIAFIANAPFAALSGCHRPLAVLRDVYDGPHIDERGCSTYR